VERSETSEKTQQFLSRVEDRRDFISSRPIELQKKGQNFQKFQNFKILQILKKIKIFQKFQNFKKF
jgi:hypothetical protein